ncbi:hypothetical protein vseg_016668 [Gypsophila vaccaria]
MEKEHIVDDSITMISPKYGYIPPVIENPVTEFGDVGNPLTEFGNSEDFLPGSIDKTLEIDEVLGIRENPFDNTVEFENKLMDFSECSDVLMTQVTKTLEIDEVLGSVENAFDKTVEFENKLMDFGGCSDVLITQVTKTLEIEENCCEKEGISGEFLSVNDDHGDLAAKTLGDVPETVKLGSLVSECRDTGGFLVIDDAEVAKTVEETTELVKTVSEFTRDVAAEFGGVTVQECNEEEGDKVENVRVGDTVRSSGEKSEDDEHEGGGVHLNELVENSMNVGNGSRGAEDGGDSTDVECSSDEKELKYDRFIGPLRPSMGKHCDCMRCNEREQREQFRRVCDGDMYSDGEDDCNENWRMRMMGYRSQPYFRGSDHPFFHYPHVPDFYRNYDRFGRRRVDFPMSKQEHHWRMRNDLEYRMYHQRKRRYYRQVRFEGEAEDSPFNGPGVMNRGDGVMERESRWNHNFSSALPETELYPVGAGLANLGNTCFLNAIIQCFTHSVPLVEGLQSLKHEASSHGNDEFCVLCAVHQQVELSLTFSGKVVSPYNLVNNLSHISSDFRRYQQEDAHEFLQCLLDKLDSHWSEHELKAEEGSSSRDSLVNQIFGGRLLSQLRCCKCGHVSDSYEPVNNLSLEIEDVGDLESAFKSFTKVENLEDFTCGGCNEKVVVEKQLLVDQGPSVAALHLKRFKSDGIRTEKIEEMVKYPLEFDMEPYTNGAKKDTEDWKYELLAFVVHIGLTSTIGHYFCYIRTSPDTWYRFDDSKVTRVSEATALDQEAYILFYARKGTPWFSDLLEKWKAHIKEKSDASPKSVLDSTNVPSTTSVHPGATLNGCKDSDATDSALVIYAEPLSCLRPDEIEKESPTLAEANPSGFSSLIELVHNDVSISEAEANLKVSEGANLCSDELSSCLKVETGTTESEACSVSNVENPSVDVLKDDGVDLNPCVSTEPGSSDKYNDKEEEPAAEQATYQIPPDHLKLQEKASTSVKGRSGKAVKYVKLSGMLFDRRRILMAGLTKKRRKPSCSTHKHSPKKRVKISPKRPLRTVAATV